MSYGLQIWDSLGSLLFDLDDRTTRLIYTTYVTTSGSIELNELNGISSIQFVEMTNTFTSVSTATYTISRSGNTISWTLPSGFTGNLFVFAYI